MAAVKKEISIRKECDRVVKEDKELERAVVRQIRKLKKSSFEEFRAEVCIRLEDLYKTLNILGNEICHGYAQDHENMENLLALMKKGRNQDQREFKNLMHNDEVMHKWIGDVAEMSCVTSMLAFKLFHKRGMTGKEVRSITGKYHLVPHFLDDPKSPWKKNDLLSQLREIAEKMEGGQS